MVDAALRTSALSAVVQEGVASTPSPTAVPPRCSPTSATPCAAMLEEKLGGVVRVQYFKDAVPR